MDRKAFYVLEFILPKLKSKLFGRAKPVLIPSHPSSILYSPDFIRA